MKIFYFQMKMLVLFILIINTADFCLGKALLEEAESNRGKRLYNLPYSGLHQTYDPQSNAKQWMKGNFYEPQVDGQPIYLPAVDQPGSYNEFLDAYYKAYSPAWNLATPARYTYDAENPENSQTIKTSDKRDGFKYTFPTSEENEFSVKMSTSDSDDESEDDGQDFIDETLATALNEKSDTLELQGHEKFKEPVVHESVKSEFINTKPLDYDQYDMPVIVKTVKQTPKANNTKYIVHKKSSTPKSTVKTVIKDAPNQDGVKYASPISKESKFPLEMSTSDDYEDYGDPEIIDKIKTEELNTENLDITSELEGQEKFEEPVVRESLKKSELAKAEPEDQNQYDMPVIVKTVKQKPNTNNAEKDSHQTPSASKTNYKKTQNSANGYDKKNGVEYESPASKQNEFSVELNTSDYDLQSQDYDTKVTDDTIVTELDNGNIHMTSELTIDKIEDSVLSESLKPKSDLYDMPVVVKTKQKSKTNNAKKTTQKKLKTKPQLKNDYDHQTQTVKAKPNKKQITTSAQKYGDKTNQNLKKSKGKRRKQYSKSNSRTDESVDIILDSSNIPIKTQENKILKTKSVKSKGEVVTKQYSECESVTKVNEIAKSNSKHKPTITDKNSKPVTAKEKVVVKTDTKYQPIKKNEKATIKSDFEDKPVKENIEYTGELKKEDIVTKNLNSQDDLTESNINIGNKNPLENDPDLGGSLVLSESEVSTKFTESNGINSELNFESPNSGVAVKPESIIPNIDDFRGLSSMNSNIWSMLFNPNAEQNKLKLKRCITRTNETGFCTYIQNCEVPHIATSLEQLLNNACVIDDIFIGVCCPEFPVQTIKVHWDQTPSDFDNTIEDEFGHIAEDCGIRSNEALEMQSWPWKAPLVSMSNGKIFCGGVVVSEDHVLTAAHCTTKIPKNQILVRLGQYDDESGDDYAVVEIKRHAQYNPRTMQNDIALLKLGRRIMNDAHIGIICLPDEEHPENNHNGEIATLLGWRGIFGTKSRDPEFLKVISNKECENKLGMKVLNTSLCTETRKESERTCNADSGAPLVIEDDGRYEVTGILSWNRNDCDQRFPSTFSRVSSYTGWIKNHIE